MSIKRAFFDCLLTWEKLRNCHKVQSSCELLVLRNNDFGDLLTTTPLFQALSLISPELKVDAGVGSWGLPILENNPYLNDVITINAPWHNKFICPEYRENTARGVFRAFKFIFRSGIIKILRKKQYAIGIDVLGSYFGALLLLNARVGKIYGVRGYAGGETACEKTIPFNPDEHVSRQALRFAELLGLESNRLPEIRPQLFLTGKESHWGENFWKDQFPKEKSNRIVIAHGGGFKDKCWPLENFRRLCENLEKQENCEICIVGGPGDQKSGDLLCHNLNHCYNSSGNFTLRQTFSVLAASDLVVTNSTMTMHAAAAFKIPGIVVLGSAYDSARQHACQWSYPEQIVCGPESSNGTLTSSEEVTRHLQTLSVWRQE